MDEDEDLFGEVPGDTWRPGRDAVTIDRTTGETILCPGCESLGRQLAEERTRYETVLEDLVNSEIVVRNLRREITKLKNEADREVANKRDGALIQDIADYWREKCNKPRAKVSVDGKRADVVWARIQQKPKGFSVEEIKQAIDGYAAFPYVGQGGRVRAGTPKQRHDDLELICRDEKNVEQGMRLAERAATEGDHDDDDRP